MWVAFFSTHYLLLYLPPEALMSEMGSWRVLFIRFVYCCTSFDEVGSSENKVQLPVIAGDTVCRSCLSHLDSAILHSRADSLHSCCLWFWMTSFLQCLYDNHSTEVVYLQHGLVMHGGLHKGIVFFLPCMNCNTGYVQENIIKKINAMLVLEELPKF